MKKTAKISKILSANDIGLTGTHQAGILIPKEPSILSFFPFLSPKEKNPRVTLVFHELNDITRWNFNFIYYNNRLFGGTRNEFRLTCMTKYLNTRNAHIGDVLVLSKEQDGHWTVELNRTNSSIDAKNDILILSGGWKIIEL